MWEERIALYDSLITKCPNIERKGKTVPYTSANGYMFSLVNKAGEIGIRFSKEDQERFMKDHNTSLFKSHGAVMNGYVLIPDAMLLENLDLLATYLNKSHEYVKTLKPK